MLNVGDKVSGFCKGCKIVKEMRYDGPVVKGKIEPGFEKYADQKQYTCITCGFSVYGENPPVKPN